MVKSVRVLKKKAETARKKLSALNLLDSRYKIKRAGSYVYFPVKQKPPANLGFGAPVDVKTRKKEIKHRTLESILKGKLKKTELELLKTSYDIIGNLAIVEIPEKLKAKKKLIGKALLKLYPKLAAVFKKSSKVSGEYRVREIERVAGTGSSETLHKEHGCTYKLDMSKVFFSPRLSTERLRVANQVKPGEIVLDMFAGIGPFSILIAKKQPEVKKIYAIDINPDAVAYLKQNINLNRAWDKVVAIKGDAPEIIEQKLKNKVNRVIMNLPRTNKNFFPGAIKALKVPGIIHYYKFASTEEEVLKYLESNLKTKFKVLEIRKVKPYAPREWNFCVDMYINKK